MTEDEMVGWHHQLNGHEFKQALGDGEGQGSLACCSPWGRKESGMIKQLTTATAFELGNHTPRNLRQSGIRERELFLL